MKILSGLVVLKCEEFNYFPFFLRNMFSDIRNSIRGLRKDLSAASLN